MWYLLYIHIVWDFLIVHIELFDATNFSNAIIIKNSRLFFSLSTFDIVCKIIILSRVAENKIFYFSLEISLTFASDVNVGKTNELPVRHISIDTR